MPTKKKLERKPFRRSGRPSHAVISRSEVITAAIAQIDKVGLEKFSLRQLASRLGVSGPALYYHFANRDELLRKVVATLAAQMKAPRDQLTWQGYVMQNATIYRDVLLSHPNLISLFAARPWSDVDLNVVEKALQQMEDNGVPADLGLLIFRASEVLAVGSAMLNDHLDTSVYGDVGPEYPALRAAIAADTLDSEQTFQALGLALITGLTASALSRSSAAR